MEGCLLKRIKIKMLTSFLALFLFMQVITIGIPAKSLGHMVDYCRYQSALKKEMIDLEFERKVDQLFLLIQKRLVVMHQVARTKWHHNLSIVDKIREINFIDPSRTSLRI